MAADRTPYVYFAQVRGGGPIKIGSSIGPKDRIRQLQSWCPFPLDFLCMIEGCVIEEALLHEVQMPFCIHHEWFEPNAALSEIIAHAVAHGCLPDALEDEADRRRAAWAIENDKWRKQCAEVQDRLSRGIIIHAPRGRATGWNKNPESLAKFREKRAASDARRKAAKGAGRTVEFKVIANPLSAPK